MSKSGKTPRELAKHGRSYVLVLFRPGPNFQEEGTTKDDLQKKGINFFFQKYTEGVATLAGLVLDDPSLKAIWLLNLESKNEANELLKSDPAVQAGHLVYELYDLFTSASFIQANEPKI